MGDAQTFWLNLTNAVLGIAVVACSLAVTAAVVREAIAKARRRASLSAELDRDMRNLTGVTRPTERRQ